MIVKPYSDPIVTAETFLNELLQKVFQNCSARHSIGFSHISQTTTPEGLPQWYLWFADKKGAYSLTIREDPADCDATGKYGCEDLEENPAAPYLLIRYFPDMEDPVFDSLSCYEQIIRMGPLFDATGTPTFDGGRALHNSFYVAGRIDVVFNHSKSNIGFYCTAPEQWRDYRVDGLVLTDDRGVSRSVLSPGECDRDFPGWDLSFFLFDKLISSFCFMSGQAPRSVGYATKPSVHFAINSKQVINVVPDETITDTMLGVAFFTDNDEGRVTEQIGIFEKRFCSQGHKIKGMWHHPDKIPVSLRAPEWWSLKDRHFHADSDHVCSCYK